jgi:sulfur carrier protein
MGPSVRPRLKVLVNGAPVETDVTTLAALIENQGHGGARIATAVNGAFVPARAREAHVLHAGDSIEIVSARQGG